MSNNLTREAVALIRALVYLSMLYDGNRETAKLDRVFEVLPKARRRFCRRMAKAVLAC